RLRTDIEISFVERQRLDDRSELVKNSANHCGSAAINIEPCRKDNQVRAALECHERRHGRAYTERARLIIARGQHAAPLARAAHANRLAAQRRPIANLNRSIETVHVEMNDGVRRLFHVPICSAKHCFAMLSSVETSYEITPRVALSRFLG